MISDLSGLPVQDGSLRCLGGHACGPAISWHSAALGAFKPWSKLISMHYMSCGKRARDQESFVVCDKRRYRGWGSWGGSASPLSTSKGD